MQWVEFRANYKPKTINEVNGIIHVSRNLHIGKDVKTNEDEWVWEECELTKTEFHNIISLIDVQTSESIFDLANLSDMISEAINDLAIMIDDLESRISLLERKEENDGK